MPSDRNINQLEEIKTQISKSNFVISTGFSGISAQDMTSLKKVLRSHGASFKVVKNTLAAIAADELGRPEIKKILSEQTALLLCDGDPIEASKSLLNFLDENHLTVNINGGILDGTILSSPDIKSLSMTKPIPLLISDIMGQLLGIISGLASVINRPNQNLVTVLQRRSEQG
jgi:large subunit ribosomal protein L10